MHFLIDLLSESRTKSINIPGRALKSVQEHERILEAIKQNNIELAQERMIDHIESVECSISQNTLSS
jgi:GntR family transcriptional repressor for pyruvate dehydrogenase complex